MLRCFAMSAPIFAKPAHVNALCMIWTTARNALKNARHALKPAGKWLNNTSKIKADQTKNNFMLVSLNLFCSQALNRISRRGFDSLGGDRYPGDNQRDETGKCKVPRLQRHPKCKSL